MSLSAPIPRARTLVPALLATLACATLSAGSAHAATSVSCSGDESGTFSPALSNTIQTVTYGLSESLTCSSSTHPSITSGEVDGVLTATGASKVDLVGWSQGGMMPRYYLKNLGGAAKVNALIGLASSNHGTTVNGLTTLTQALGLSGPIGTFCPACTQQIAGSSFMTALNAGGDTVPGVTYTVIQSRYDEVVTPYTSAFLSGPDVTNITLQDQCLLDLGEHLSMAYDHIAGQDVLSALDPAHPTTPTCSPVVAAVGG